MPVAKKTRTATRKSRAQMPPTIRNVVPDKLDIRDRIYMPAIRRRPEPSMAPRPLMPVLNQEDTNACTGFALATVVHFLQCADHANFHERNRVSPYMLYSMARRYDEFPGSPEADTGSSLRGAMKGWYKHGVCREVLWSQEGMPEDKQGKVKAADDWWLDAVRRPLGAYYRVDARSVTDMHVALSEVKILYASAICHAGWDRGFDSGLKKTRGYWTIPAQKGKLYDGGHAFAVVGYDEEGFIIQNSWDTTWGTGGFARLTYEDWIENAMDCWVAQLGVVTEQQNEIAGASTLRVKDGKVQLANIPTLRNREIGPFIVDMENNGRLSNSGDFRTGESDVKALVNHHLKEALKKWKVGPNDPVDIAIYAHGGLTSEDDAATTAANWITALYDSHIFPIFFMWETDLWSTLKGRLQDIVARQPRPTAGILDSIKDIWNKRLERLLSVPGSFIWTEMKQNAEALSQPRPENSESDRESWSGGAHLYEAFKESAPIKDKSNVRLHLIGHSAGAIVHSRLIDRLIKAEWRFKTVNFMAPAVRVDTFMELVAPHIRSGKIDHYNQFHLSDKFESDDPTCRPILGYDNSLLYLVSQSFENGATTPILGMEKYFDQILKKGRLTRNRVNVFQSPGADSKSTTHGGFDDDPDTMKKVISLIKKAK